MFVIGALLGTLILTTGTAMVARHRGPAILVGFFAVSVISSVVVAGKLVDVWGYTLSAALFLYSATFLATDVLGEFWGRRAAAQAVIAGLIGDIIFLYTVRVAIAWEASPYWENQEAFATALGSTWRIVLASVTAYVAAQIHDIFAYEFWKKKSADRHLWWRNNASTWISQLIDTVIFYTVAFAGTGAPLFELILVTYLFKIGIAVIDTPFLYFIRWYYRRGPIAEGGVREAATAPA